MRMFALTLTAVLALAGAARAEVTQRSESGFQVVHAVDVSAPPAKVYAALGEVGGWWDDEHTYSGRAANMTLALTPGGCFCETLPNGGGVQHGRVILAIPGSLLRLDGALGPLQGAGVSAVLTFEIKPKAKGSQVTATYNVGGYNAAGVTQWAGAVDQVVGNQVTRLARYVETVKR